MKFNIGDKVRMKSTVKPYDVYNGVTVAIDDDRIYGVYTVEETDEDDGTVLADCGRGLEQWIGEDALEFAVELTLDQKREFLKKFCMKGSCIGCPCNSEFCNAIPDNKTEEELDAVIAKIDAAGLTAEDVHADCWPSSQAYLEAHGEKPTPAEPEAPTGIHETVNHPDHYQGEHECIDVMRAMFGDEAVKGFCRCNAYKYRFRAAQKNGEEDLRKARWYEDYLIKMEDED